jgi:molybdopterin-guanine dinucleotide biosynthesis protein B
MRDLLAKISPVDLVIVEGFKTDTHPKIEIYRAANGKPPLHPDDPAIVGIASDTPIETRLPSTNLDDISAIAEMVQKLAVSVVDLMAREKANG